MPTSTPRTFALIVLYAFAQSASATTNITFSRAEISYMAGLWETDAVSISALPNAQYPAFAGTWDFIFPHTGISSDGDIHSDTGIDSSGTGSTNNNAGESPLVCEVINATQTQLSHLDGLTGARANFHGIFRLYTEHPAERHFELHPLTRLETWNGSAFVADSDYHSNIVADPNGTTHADSTLISLLDGSETVSATIESDGTNVDLTFPSPSVNYVQYAGTVVSGVASDSTSSYFFFQPSLVSSATVRCRLIASTTAATAATGLMANQSLTVNALTRTDMAGINTQTATMNAGQNKTFTRPVELIVLGLPSVGPTPTPTPSATPTPTPSATPSGTFSNTSAITISGAGTGKATPYPATISVSGVVGLITKVTATLNNVNQNSSNDDATNIDIQLMGPLGQNVMLMSDAGGTRRLRGVTLTFDDAATNSLSQTNQITSGTFKPTNYAGDADAFPSPAPTATPGVLLSAFNNTNPNGLWSLFVLDEYSGGAGNIAGGWSLTITASPAAPLLSTNAASGIDATAATVSGTVNPLGLATTCQFQFGTTMSYGFTQILQAAGNGTADAPVSLALNGLKPATTYHFRLIGSSAAGNAAVADKTFTTAAFHDTDGDGMPDDYEIAHNFNPGDGSDAALDSDGDGMTNLQEYLAGTDPHSNASILRIQSIKTAGGDVIVTFSSVLGKTYTLEAATTVKGTWSTVSDPILGTGGIVAVSDIEGADLYSKRVYRIVVVP